MAIMRMLSDMSDHERSMLMVGKYTTPELKAFKETIEQASNGFGSSLGEIMKTAGVELAGAESSYATRLLQAVAEDVKSPLLSAEALFNNAAANPVLGMVYKSIPEDTAGDLARRVFESVRRGVSDGKTTDQITRGLMGTKASSYKDGELEVSRRAAEMLVRTSRTHVSNSAYEQTYAAMGVEYVIVCATLDGRTSMYCATHDGVKYKVGTAYPSPPYHPNCRTVLMPDLGDMSLRPGNTSFKSIGKMNKDEKESVKYEMVKEATYEQWFSNQSDQFQRRWLGAKRFELYKNGDYEIKRFVDVQGRMYTLEELRDRDESTFIEVFGK